jgi:PAS domain-containing protein
MTRQNGPQLFQIVQMIRSRILIWFVPVVLPVAALLLQLATRPYLQPGIWFFFFPAVFISAWLGGTRMSVPAAVLSACLARYFFMEPQHSMTVTALNQLFPLASFVVAGALLGFMRNRMHDAQTSVVHRDHDLSLMFNTMSEAVALNECVFDAKGEMIDYRILRVNEAFYSTADYQGKNVVGALATELYGMSQATIREFWMNHRHRNTVQQVEFLSPISQKYYIISTSPFVRGHFVTSFFDITTRKRMEEALQQSESRFRILVESINDIVYTLDAEGRYESVFGSWVKKSGLKAEDLLGKTARDTRLHCPRSERKAA